MLCRNRVFCFVLFLHVQIEYIFKISQDHKLTDGAERSLYSPSSGSLDRFLISKLCTLTIKKESKCECQQEPQVCVRRDGIEAEQRSPGGLH